MSYVDSIAPDHKSNTDDYHIKYKWEVLTVDVEMQADLKLHFLYIVIWAQNSCILHKLTWVTTIFSLIWNVTYVAYDRLKVIIARWIVTVIPDFICCLM